MTDEQIAAVVGERDRYLKERDAALAVVDHLRGLFDVVKETVEEVKKEVAKRRRNPLFLKGEVTLRSGKKSNYKIECDALTPEDWEGVAAMAREEGLLPEFGHVFGVPRGGIPFASALEPYRAEGCRTVLIAEDVWTTGGSVKRFIDSEHSRLKGYELRCVCLFSRGPTPEWVTSILPVGGRK